MSLYGMMRTGVSGMNAQANRLGTVSDNIANADTTGYKRASTEFSSLILPGSDGSYNSGGVNSKVRYAISDQGTFTYTTSPSDLAINGEGFFVVRGQDGAEYMTRAGSFVPDGGGNLVNAAGYTLMGYPYDADTDPTIVVNGYDGLSPVNLQAGSLTAKATSTASLNINLPSEDAIGSAKTTSLSVYDSLGNTHLLDFNFTKSAANVWDVEVVNRSTGTSLGTTTMTFDPATGNLTTPLPSLGALGETITTADGESILGPIDVDLTNSTQLNFDFAVTDPEADGNAPSQTLGYQISSDGIVSVKYENGDIKNLYRLAMANVQSPDNLDPLPGNVYAQGLDSGVTILGFAGSSGFGTILSGALEDSNVDIAEELTTMIASQRSYTANSKVFQTGSDLLDVLVNLKR